MLELTYEDKLKVLNTPKLYLNFAKMYLGGTIDLDPCPHSSNVDGLTLIWTGNVFVNPPWGYDYDSVGLILTTWLVKGLLSKIESHNTRILFYIPYYPESAWWEKCVENRMKVVAIFPKSLSKFLNKGTKLGYSIDTCLVEIL